MTAFLIFVYLVAIVGVNQLIAFYGPTWAIYGGLIFVSLNFVTRDYLHRKWRNNNLILKMGVLILTGSVISFVINQHAGRVAVASFIAFAMSESVDTLVCHKLLNRHQLIYINGSNLFGTIVDSIVFPTLAFGAFMPNIIIGQFGAKMLGGLIWSLIGLAVARIYHNLFKGKAWN